MLVLDQAKRKREEAIPVNKAKRRRKKAVLQGEPIHMGGMWQFFYLPRALPPAWRRNKTVDAVVLPDIPQPIRWGRRSMHDSKAWPCPKCQHVNKPTKHLIVNLPALTCRMCKADMDVNFKFSFGNLEFNGICPIGEIKDQGDTDFCVPFGFTMACEISLTIKALLAGKRKGHPQLDPYFLLFRHFEKMWTAGVDSPKFNSYALAKEYILSLEEGQLPDFKSTDATDSMANILMWDGIYCQKDEQRYKFGVDKIDNSFESITSNLADGHVLVVNMIPGKSFEDLKYGEIYKAPYNSESHIDSHILASLDAHFVVLIGACRSELGDYLYFVNSYGNRFCMRVQSGKICGGIGKLRAGDTIMEPYRLLRCVRDE